MEEALTLEEPWDRFKLTKINNIDMISLTVLHQVGPRMGMVPASTQVHPINPPQIQGLVLKMMEGRKPALEIER
jgi:hypothetical protein